MPTTSQGAKPTIYEFLWPGHLNFCSVVHAYCSSSSQGSECEGDGWQERHHRAELAVRGAARRGWPVTELGPPWGGQDLFHRKGVLTIWVMSPHVPGYF